MRSMEMVRTVRAATLAVMVGLIGAAMGCSPAPSASPTQVASSTLPPTPGATPGPSATPGPTSSPPFPLAVVTGFANLRSAISLAQLGALAHDGKLVLPCGVEVIEPALDGSGRCRPADEIVDAIDADPQTVALLPPGLVEPATKILPVDGDGPFGLFGADLFGDGAARAKPYPVRGRPSGSVALDAAWLAYDPAAVWTIASVGGSCPDRGAAYQAIKLGKGWAWDFDGGTAAYDGIFLNPNPPEGINQHLIVAAHDTGHAGTVARLMKGAELTIADVECPIVDADEWVPNYGRELVFSVSEDVLPLWVDKLGIDLVYLAANHQSDKGRAGIRESLRLLDQYGILATGLGLDIDQATAPAYVERAGVKVGFVAWNDVPGVVEADADTAGVPWLRKAAVFASVARARAGGADIVICDPQWWGGAEYHSDLRNAQFDQLAWFDEAGCDHVIGAGTHLAGPIGLERVGDAVRLMVASEGNFMFGQSFWQLTQEGVIVTMAFRGTELVNVHLIPYVMLYNARAHLTDPEGDGRHVLERVLSNSDVEYRG